MDFKELIKKNQNLIDSNSNLIETVKEYLSVIPSVLEAHSTAIIPEEELDKIRTTPCALPETSEVSSKIAGEVRSDISDSVDTSVQDGLTKAISKTRVKTEVVHTFATPWEMARIVEKKMRCWFYALVIACGLMATTLIGIGIAYFNSNLYLGKRYVDVCRSEYITNEEREALMSKTYTFSSIPKELAKNKTDLKRKISACEAELERRELESNRTK